MRCHIDNSPEVRAFACAKLGIPNQPPGPSLAVLDKDGMLVGAVLFFWHTGPSIEMSVAGRGVFSRPAWQKIGEFVFGALRCERLGVTVRSDRSKVQELVARVGFTHEGRVRRWFGDMDGDVFSLLREEAVTKRLWSPQHGRTEGA